MTRTSDVDAYQQWTDVTAVYAPEYGLLSTTLGLVGEAGELANQVKKILRDAQGVLHPEMRDTLIAELGDVLWYAARLATELGVPLSTVLAANHHKLIDRLARGLIHGQGDTR